MKKEGGEKSRKRGREIRGEGGDGEEEEVREEGGQYWPTKLKQ